MEARTIAVSSSESEGNTFQDEEIAPIRSLELYQYGQAWQLPSVDPDCVAVQAFLKASKLPFKCVNCNNPSMSPTGELPFVRHSGYGLFTTFDSIVKLARKMGSDISGFLSDVQRAEVAAYQSLVRRTLWLAAQYELWCETSNFYEVALKTYGNIHPFPLNYVLSWQKRHAVESQVRLQGIESAAQLYEDAGNVYAALSHKLQQQQYFFGNTITELDAVIFGHLCFVLHAPLGSHRLYNKVAEHQNLVEFKNRVLDTLFGN